MSQHTDSAIPILQCSSISATTAFYEGLGFEGGAHGFSQDYAIFKRGAIELHFFTHAELVPAQSWAGCYIRVGDVQSLYQACLTQASRAGILLKTSPGDSGNLRLSIRMAIAWRLAPPLMQGADLGGMMRAPVMAVVFAFELTQDANALLPVLAAATVAYGFTVLTMHRSILTEKIARRGHHIFREYSIDPLERHSVAEVMSTKPVSIDADALTEDVLASHFGLGQQHRAYPVTRDGILLGMLDRAALDAHPQAHKVGELYGVNPPLLALEGETCRTLATRLAVHQLERLPVVDGERRLVGFISRSDLVKPALALHDEEQERQTMRRFWPGKVT